MFCEEIPPTICYDGQYKYLDTDTNLEMCADCDANCDVCETYGSCITCSYGFILEGVNCTVEIPTCTVG
jgi:hypothetical protein